MNKELTGKKWTGAYTVPLSISLSIFALFVSFQLYAGTTGWKIASTILFVISILWYIWYLSAKTIKKHEKSTSKVLLIANRRRRKLVLFIPVFAAVVCGGAFINPEKINLFSVQGEKSVVKFSSNPEGAKVRYAWILYADGDPWLEDQSGEREIIRLPRKTVTKANVEHGHYWAVFELGDKRVQKKIVVEGPTEVSVEF